MSGACSCFCWRRNAAENLVAEGVGLCPPCNWLYHRSLDDPDKSLPFIKEILSSLRKEVDGKAALLGFVGSPWTLAAYAMEGSADKNLVTTKSIMLHCRFSYLAAACLLASRSVSGGVALAT